jgi:hypothetical protein
LPHPLGHFRGIISLATVLTYIGGNPFQHHETLPETIILAYLPGSEAPVEAKVTTISLHLFHLPLPGHFENRNNHD